jgi:bifunctional DNA-binding transcriptional regulator/antitoxin component of YhaV-PrlF toxin-antitoxin module
MSKVISKITSKWQITIPEVVRNELPLEVGQRIAWAVKGDTIVGRRVRSVRELAGSLKGMGSATVHPKTRKSAFAGAAVERYQRLSKAKR